MRDHSYYFKSTKFNTFRCGSYLVILWHVPLTLCSLTSPLDLYHVTRITLPAPTMEIHYTELSLDFEAIAYSHDSIAKMSLSDKDDDVQ